MKDLRQFTPARIALGRTGNSVATRDLLDFQLAHARARDAVHFPLDTFALRSEFEAAGWNSVIVHSAARNRHEYLKRPDLGRRLNADSRKLLEEMPRGFDRIFVVADGLSPMAAQKQATSLLREISQDGFPAGIVIAEQARVAIADEIGEILKSSLSVVLIGERPGLTTPDSLGIYVTWQPHIGCTDERRNCISNIHAGGLSAGAAGELLNLLIDDAQTRKLTGVSLLSPRPRQLY